MKKLLLVLVLLVGTLYAKKMEYQISLVGMNMDYKEYDRAGVILDSEKSDLTDITGAEVAYRFYLNESSNLEAKFLGVSGETVYKGSYIGSGLPYGSVVSTTQDTVYDLSFAYNGINTLQNGFSLLGGVAVGYRYWQRELSALQIEEYYWPSVRINAGARYQYADFSVAAKVEYQYGIDPQMSATGFSKDFQLSAADITKISVPLRYAINDKIDLSCTYIFEYQKIKESNVIYDSYGRGYLEPDSHAYNQYVKFGVIFKY
jgi:hypothetical protein